MKLSHSKTPTVTYEVAKGRVLAGLPTLGDTMGLTAILSPTPPSWCADLIWPGHYMTPQGARGREWPDYGAPQA